MRGKIKAQASRGLAGPQGARVADGERRGGRARRQRPHAALRLPAPRARPDRHACRLRARRLRRLHDASSTAERRAPASPSRCRLSGAEIRTIESVAGEDGTLHPVQQAFQDCHALQCGYCTPGMIMNIAQPIRDGRDARPVGRGRARDAVGQSLPLHRLPEHHRGGPPGGRRPSRREDPRCRRACSEHGSSATPIRSC